MHQTAPNCKGYISKDTIILDMIFGKVKYADRNIADIFMYNVKMVNNPYLIMTPMA